MLNRLLSRLRHAALPGSALLLLFAAACGGGNNKGTAQQQAKDTLNVAVASYDLVANKDNRFIAGLLTLDNDFISYGSVQMRFSYLGDGKQNQDPRFFAEDKATFLQIPGEGVANPPDVPTAGPASDGRGVYEVNPIKFDQAGYWQVDVTAQTKDGEMKGTSAFAVNDTNSVPAPGDKAIPSDSLTVDSAVPASAIDSRAKTVSDIPDAALHQISIADALKQNKPLLIVFSTPVFCISQFCGPVTDMVADIQKRYADKADFVHVEIWGNYQEKQINKAAADWLYRNGDLNEPWVFLVGKDGTILQRWDNVATEGEIVPALEKAIAGS